MNRILTAAAIMLWVIMPLQGRTYTRQHAALNLYGSTAQSPYTFFYRISNQEAQNFILEPKAEKIYPLLYDKADSIESAAYNSGKKSPQLPTGHFISVSTTGNTVKTNLITKQDVYPYVMKNGNDLMIRVLDTLGNNISDAEITVGKKRLKYDKKQQIYILPKFRQSAPMVLKRQDMWLFYKLENEMLRKQAPSVERENEIKLRMFAVTNKPKYRPRDTVYFKLYMAEGKDWNLFNDSIQLSLYQNKLTDVCKLKPYAPGLYTGQFVLADTMDLRLDSYVSLQASSLSNRKKKTTYNNAFAYQDYVLKSSSLELKPDSSCQLYGDSMRMTINARDENRLPLQNARCVITVSCNYISQPILRETFTPTDYVVYRDTVDLAHEGETRTAIPWQCMPKANFSYTVKAELISADEEHVTEYESINFVYKDQEISSSIKGGKINFQYHESKKASYTGAKLTAYGMSGRKVSEERVELPMKINLDPYISKYEIQTTQGLKKTFSMEDTEDSLSVETTRKPTSVVFEVKNPCGIVFNYNIYCEGKELRKGTGSQLRYSARGNMKKDYRIVLQYMWGGMMKSETYTSWHGEGQELKLTATHKRLVYPGEKDEITIKATRNGEPVEGVDITAYAPTIKFAPGLPTDFWDLGEKQQEYVPAADYSIEKYDLRDKLTYKMQQLDTSFFGRLDTIDAYRFLYPDTPFYKKTVKAEVSQIAPFVTHEGELRPIHVVYIDEKPSYISFVNNNHPYACSTVPGRHKVWVRTSDYMFDLGIVTVETGEKLILSIDEDKYEKKVKYTAELTENEKKDLLQYLMPISNSGSSSYYIMQDDHLYRLDRDFNGRRGAEDMVIGPVRQSSMSIVKTDKSYPFQFRAWNKYDFGTKGGDVSIVPYRLDEKTYYQQFPSDFNAQGVTDSVYTVDRLWRELTYGKMQTRDYRRNGSLSNDWNDKEKSNIETSRLTYKTEEGKTESPLNYLLINKRTGLIEDIYGRYGVRAKPGEWSLMALFRNGAYAEVPVTVRKDYNTILFDTVAIKTPTQKSIAYNHYLDMIAQNIDDCRRGTYRNIVNAMNSKPEDIEGYLYGLSKQRITADVNGDKAGGFVKDQKGNPVTGARVYANQGNVYTVTDFSGYFSIIGKGSLTVIAEGKRPCEITLRQSATAAPDETMEVVMMNAYNGWVEYNRPTDLQAEGDTVVWSDYGNITPIERYSATEAFAAPAVFRAKRGKTSGWMASDMNVSVRGTGNTAKLLYIVDGKATDDISDIPPSRILKMEAMKEKAATRIYGKRAENGVVVVTTTKKKPHDEEPAGAESQMASSIRNNFRDYAIWQPRSRTDENGVAKFSVTYPDDATRWKLMLLGLKDNKYTSMQASDVFAYKPLMAQLSAPRFMISGDTTYVGGYIKNYLKQKTTVTADFKLDGQMVRSQEITLNGNQGNQDYQKVTAPLLQDTMTAEYSFVRTDGYFDGERRQIPIYRKGLTEKSGELYVISSEDAEKITLPEGELKVTAYASELQLTDAQSDHILKTEDKSNDALASMLEAYLIKQKICKIRQQKFRYKNDVKQLIKLLLKNQNTDGLWGWWGKSNTTEWVAVHILNTLEEARKDGYAVNMTVSREEIADKLNEQLKYDIEPEKQLCNAEMALTLGVKTDYKSALNRLEQKAQMRSDNGNKAYRFTAMDELRLMRLRQLTGEKINVKAMDKYKRETALHNVYYSAGEATWLRDKMYLVYDNDNMMTLMAYKILKSGGASETQLQKLRNWFFEKKRSGAYNMKSSYETIKELEMMTDGLEEKGEGLTVSSTVKLSGAISDEIKEYPYTKKCRGEELIVRKSGKAPLYISVYKEKWVTMPETKQGDLQIETEWPDEMKKGVETEVKVKLKAAKDAEYVKIEVPIPAGCEPEKDMWICYRNLMPQEAYRELRKDKVVIYCNGLQAKDHTFRIKLMPRHSGTYNVNPASVEMVYQPVMNANNKIKKIRITD